MTLNLGYRLGRHLRAGDYLFGHRRADDAGTVELTTIWYVNEIVERSSDVVSGPIRYADVTAVWADDPTAPLIVPIGENSSVHLIDSQRYLCEVPELFAHIVDIEDPRP